jgi:hypothetical protein
MARQISMAALLLLVSTGIALAQSAGTPAERPSGFPGVSPFPPSTAATPAKKPAKNPAETAAQRQSGLTDAQARTLLQQEGYTGVSNLRAEPNSIWVWQADAMKDGRRVRLGVDYRGKLLEFSGGARPCTSLGGGAGSGFVGSPGARLSEATGCSGR